MIDNLKQNPYISDDVSIQINYHPFRYYIIENFFKPEVYDLACSNTKDLNKTPRFCDISASSYKARIKGLCKADLKDPFHFFASEDWHNFNSNLFDAKLNNYMSLNFHYHDKPGEKGFVHNDFNICGFKQDNFYGHSYYHKDQETPNLKDVVRYIRSIAFIYYFSGSPIDEKDGGTEILSDFSKVEKVIPAKNNSVFCFEISPISFHNFFGSTYDRITFMGWFHSSPAYWIKRNLDKVTQEYEKTGEVSVRWNTNKAWSIEKDPEFYNVFGEGSESIMKRFNLK